MGHHQEEQRCLHDDLDDLVAVHGEDFTIIMDNGAPHASGHTRRWLSLHPHVNVLFTPFHASSANPVEAQFSVLTAN